MDNDYLPLILLFNYIKCLKNSKRNSHTLFYIFHLINNKYIINLFVRFNKYIHSLKTMSIECTNNMFKIRV